MNSVEVELQQHVGINNRRGVIVEVEHDQWVVLASVNGSKMREVGLICKHEGAPFNGTGGLREWPASVQEQIKEAVMAKLGRAEMKMFIPVEPSPLLLGEEDDDLEDTDLE